MELVKTLKQENNSLKRDLVATQERVKQLENVLGQARRMPAPQVQSAIQPRQQPTRSAPTAATNPADDTISTISISALLRHALPLD